MSEMTGNAALLAQVCGWGRGGGQAGQGLSQEPPPWHLQSLPASPNSLGFLGTDFSVPAFLCLTPRVGQQSLRRGAWGSF